MENDAISRRLFLIRSLAGVSSGWLLARLPQILDAQEHMHKVAASEAPLTFEFFSARQAAEVDAIAARIIPGDETPGAREAHVVYFIDRALSTFDKEKQPLYLKGLRQLSARRRGLRSRAATFAALAPRQQDRLLKEIENGKFFQAVRTHTIMGFLAEPKYGGNYDFAGWKLIGFQDQFFYKPPFGFYDAEAK
ncbi:MAG TPA: gluconate 2-dehydrogenase subunit 3 family protein [Blastocatellia bacterium]|nr:gluconate 2-dehydrogenase subunit 3 family protein [Blastocatellia bacterium]